MDTAPVRSPGPADAAASPAKGTDLLLALESGAFTFVEAMRNAVERLKTDAASLADIRYLSDRSIRADVSQGPDKRPLDRPRDREEMRVDDADRRIDRPEPRPESPERDADASRRDERPVSSESRTDSSRDDGPSERTPAAERHTEESAKTSPSSERSQKAGTNDSPEAPAAEAGAAASGAEATAAVHSAPAAQASTTAVARSMGQWSEMVLTELLGIVQGATPQATTGDGGDDETVDPVGREHAAQGLANALAAVTRQHANRKGDNEPGQRNADHAPQGNAFALGHETGDDDGDAAAAGFGRIAAQQASLSRVVGADNRLAVQVGVADEARLLMSRPASSLSAPGALIGDAGASADSSNGRGPSGVPVGTNPAVVAQLNASTAIASNPSVGQAAGASAGTTAIDAKAAPQAPAANHALGSNPTSGGEAQAPSQAHAPSHALASQAAAQVKSPVQAKPAHFGQAVIDQVSVHITRAAASGTDRIDIQLRPEALGRIDVRLDMATDGRVSAVITADNRDTLDLLQRDARNLERALQDAGLNADLGSLSFNLREQNPDGSGNGPAQDAPPPDAESDDPVVAEDRPASAYADLRSGAGRLDIRV